MATGSGGWGRCWLHGVIRQADGLQQKIPNVFTQGGRAAVHTIEATYRIVTPMFLGDADQKATGIRPPSIKGALRFWWRALSWPQFRTRAGGDEVQALRELHAAEARLFGLAGKIERDKQTGGQGAFLLRMTAQPPNLAVLRGGGEKVRDGWPRNNTGSGYLGFGLFEAGSQAKGNYHAPREALAEGQDFSLELRFRPGTDADDVASVRAALEAWGLFGGLGSRARRGFGSVTLIRLDDEDRLQDAGAYEQAARDVLADHAGTADLPPFTAFGKLARLRLLKLPGDKARAVHGTAGELYREHRGQPSALRGARKVPFGLPLQKVDEKNRRASPLLFHIQALAGGRFQAAALYLPARFHPDPRYAAGNQPGFFTDVERFLEAGV